MSTLFGPMRQIGYVVPDLQAAMTYWAETCRIGPWFYFSRSAYQTSSQIPTAEEGPEIAQHLHAITLGSRWS